MFTDVDMGQTHTCTFDWGEGTPQTVPAGATSCTAAHQYRDDNPTLTPSDTYPVKVTVTDNGTTNGSPNPKYDSETANLVVNNLAPVILSMTGPAGPQAIGTASTVSTTFTRCRHPGHPQVHVHLGRRDAGHHGQCDRRDLLGEPYLCCSRRLHGHRDREG